MVEVEVKRSRSDPMNPIVSIIYEPVFAGTGLDVGSITHETVLRSWEVSEQKLESSLREWDNLFVSISCEQEHVNLVLLVSITILDKEEEEILLLLSP